MWLLDEMRKSTGSGEETELLRIMFSTGIDV